MNILFVVRTLGYGGASKQLALLANALSCYNHKVFVYSYCANENKQTFAPVVTYIPEKNFPQSKAKEYLCSVFNIRRKIKEIGPDVVISWRCNAGCLAKIASLGLNAKTIFCERTDPYTETSIALKISAFVCCFSDGGVFQLEHVREYYKRLYNKSVVIPNPIGLDCENDFVVPYGRRPQRIAFVGRMVISQKRQDVALDAFKFFLRGYPDYELHFYGDGNDFEEIKKIAVQKELGKSVVFHGAVKNVIDEIQNAKVLLVSSDYEGIPNVILEAFVAGVPVVSTDCSPGGARVLIDDDENGFLAPVGDAEKLANKMSDIVRNEELAKKFIANGRAKLKKFAPDVVFQQWNEYLIQMI